MTELQIGTARPIFGDRDKSIHDNVNEISQERRNGYAWYGNAPQHALDQLPGTKHILRLNDEPADIRAIVPGA